MSDLSGRSAAIYDRGMTLSVLIIRQGSWWVAQCIEHDLSVQSPEMEALEAAFNATLAAQVDGLDAILPAPAPFPVYFAQARKVAWANASVGLEGGGTLDIEYDVRVSRATLPA